ncbi:hypothetical protein ACVXZ0_11630 [Staphylococcus aureus]
MDDFFKILTNIKKSKQQISCVPYLIENGNNIHRINKIISYETILSFSIFDRISEFDFENRNFSRYFATIEEVILDTDDRYYQMNEVQLQYTSISSNLSISFNGIFYKK